MEIKEALADIEGRLSELPASESAYCRKRLRLIKKSRSSKKQLRYLSELQKTAERGLAQVRRRRDGLPAVSFPPELPVSGRVKEIRAALRGHQVIILAGETGSGKSTQMPKICLAEGLGIRGQIGVTQPRRIAARSVAARVAEELQTELGTAVGFQVRFQEKVSRQSYIKFMTDGILLSEIQRDPQLTAYDTVIIDEAHERSLNIDFLLGYLKRLLRRRPDLKLIVTSATIDTEKFSRHFNAAPVIEVSGRTYPVDIRYMPLQVDDRDKAMNQGISDAIGSLSRIDSAGDILVFLPGERDIHEAKAFLEKRALKNTEVLPLYARLPAKAQHRIFHPGRQRRIILSTNVAETSLTVPRIRFVIDAGTARISRYSHRSRVQRLPIEPISRASADQRAGRCGRLGPGTCVRLYSEADYSLRPEFTEPEILRTSLATVILCMASMNLGAIADFPFVDRPPPKAVNDAYRLLFELRAMDADGRITPLGRRLARWPVDVRIGRMLLAGERHGALRELLILAAVLSIQDPRERPAEARQAADEAHRQHADPKSDFVALLNLWRYLETQQDALSASQFRKLCMREFLAYHRVREWRDLYRQLRRFAQDEKLPLNRQPADYDAIHRSLLSGLLSHIGRKDEDQAYAGAKSRKFHVFPGSGLFKHQPKWLMSAELVETSRLFARTNAAIRPEWLELLAGHLVRRHHFDPHWSVRRGKVLASEQVTLYGLVIVEKRRVDYSAIQAVDAREIFIRDGLVPGTLAGHYAFVDHNRRQVEQVMQLEHKRRRHDVMVRDALLQRFFDDRLPADVCSEKALKAWLTAEPDAVQRLCYSDDLLIRDDAESTPDRDYPGHLSIDGREFPLSYRFEPAAEDDGISLDTPLELLNLLSAEQLSWLVPGMLEEKISALIQSLPKPLRRPLTPASQFARRFADSLSYSPEQPPQVSLAHALSGFFLDRLGLEIPVPRWNEANLPAHLRLNIRVSDPNGALLGSNRDLTALKAQFGSRARRHFMNSAGADWRQDGLSTWSVGSLPESVRTAAGVEAYPALVDRKTSVSLRLYDDRSEAAYAHRAGLQRLLLLDLADKARYAAKNSGLRKATLMRWQSIGAATRLTTDLIESCLADIIGDLPDVRSEDQYSALRDEVRQRWLAACQRKAGVLNQILETRAGIVTALRRKSLASALAEDVQTQLDDLIYEGFLSDVQNSRLAHYPRYFQAMQIRLDRARQDPQKDAALASQVAPFWKRYLDWLEQRKPYTVAMDAYRWLIEEFRVSLFAQSLGTADKVSAKRLEQAWRQVLEEA